MTQLNKNNHIFAIDLRSEQIIRFNSVYTLFLSAHWIINVEIVKPKDKQWQGRLSFIFCSQKSQRYS